MLMINREFLGYAIVEGNEIKFCMINGDVIRETYETNEDAMQGMEEWSNSWEIPYVK